MVENHNVERTQSYQLRIVRVERDRAVEWDSTDPSWQIYKSLFRFGQQIILVKFPAELNKFTNGIAWRISSQLDIWPRHDALCWRLVNEELKSTSAFLLRNRVETIRSSEGERGGERERERPSGDLVDSEDPRAVHVWCRKCFESRACHPLVAVSATSVGSLANHSLCKCEAVLRQYRRGREGAGGGRLLAQSITMRPVYRSDNQQTRLLLAR